MLHCKSGGSGMLNRPLKPLWNLALRPGSKAVRTCPAYKEIQVQERPVANDESVLREVDQELAEEQQWVQFRRHGPFIIGAAAALVAGVAGWQAWSHYKTGAAEESALEYRNAVELLGEDEEAGRAALASVAEQSGGYGALAALQRAGSYASSGERLRALEIYRGVASGSAPKRVRELAQLRAGYLALADGRDAVIAELGALPEAENRYGYYAKEIMGLAALGAEDYETNFRQLSIDIDAPQGVRDRAEEFAALAAAARAGVNITGEARVEDLLKTVGEETIAPAETEGETEAASEEVGPAQETAEEEAGRERGDTDDHAGHDHEE